MRGPAFVLHLKTENSQSQPPTLVLFPKGARGQRVVPSTCFLNLRFNQAPSTKHQAPVIRPAFLNAIQMNVADRHE